MVIIPDSRPTDWITIGSHKDIISRENVYPLRIDVEIALNYIFIRIQPFIILEILKISFLLYSLNMVLVR